MSDVRDLMERALPARVAPPDVAAIDRRARRRAGTRRVVGAAGVFAVLAAGLAVTVPGRLGRGVELDAGSAAERDPGQAPPADTSPDGSAPEEVPIGEVPMVAGPPPPAAIPEGALVTPLPGAPISGREGAFTVWTGEELVVLAGNDGTGGPRPTDGARFDPARGTWREVPAPDQPVVIESVLAAGRQVLAIGTNQEPALPYDAPETADDLLEVRASLFDVDEGRWTELPPSPLTPRWRTAVGFTGEEVVVVGGQRVQGGAVRTLDDGAVYDLATGTWRPTAPAPSALVIDSSVWNGRELIVSGRTLEPYPGDPRWLAYDPGADTWREFPAPPLAVDRWARMGDEGHDLVAVGAVDAGPEVGDPGTGRFARYDAATDAWEDLGPAPLHVDWLGWTGDRVLATTIVSGELAEAPDPGPGPGPSTVQPLEAPDPDPLQPLEAPGPDPLQPLYALDPVTGELAVLPDPSPDRHFPARVWAGDRLLSWGGLPRMEDRLLDDGHALQLQPR